MIDLFIDLKDCESPLLTSPDHFSSSPAPQFGPLGVRTSSFGTAARSNIFGGSPTAGQSNAQPGGSGGGAARRASLTGPVGEESVLAYGPFGPNHGGRRRAERAARVAEAERLKAKTAAEVREGQGALRF